MDLKSRSHNHGQTSTKLRLAGFRRKEAVEEEKKGGAQVLSPRLEVAMGWCSPKSSRRSLVIVNLGMALTGFVFLIVGGVSLHSGPPPALQPPFVSIRLK